METLIPGGEWLVALLINLLVPALVWITVIAGLILIVREKVEEEDMQLFTSPPFPQNSKSSCGLLDFRIELIPNSEERS